jgi:hypothetical protein
MALLISMVFAVAGSVVAGIALRQICKLIKPELVSQYRLCEGRWWEEELYHCKQGLTRVPNQPVNNYTNIAYLASGLFIMSQSNLLIATMS